MVVESADSVGSGEHARIESVDGSQRWVRERQDEQIEQTMLKAGFVVLFWIKAAGWMRQVRRVIELGTEHWTEHWAGGQAMQCTTREYDDGP